MINADLDYQVAGKRAARAMHSGDHATFRHWKGLADRMAKVEMPSDQEAARNLYRDAYNAEAGVLLNARIGRRVF